MKNEVNPKGRKENKSIIHEMNPKEKFTRRMISFLTMSEKIHYYERSGRVYIDTVPMKGNGLMLLEGEEFMSFILGEAKKRENILLHSDHVKVIIDHVRYPAKCAAKPLSADARSAWDGDTLLLNTGWDDGKIIAIPPNGIWEIRSFERREFEPLPSEMRLAVPVQKQAEDFPDLLKRGIADFGEHHCLLAVTCGTMLLPATFSHPFFVFTGDEAKGKSTTMKLILQIIDPFEDGELMTVGKDERDFIALCRGRHCVALDNVSHLPFDEDLLSKMYSGGIFTARRMRTNSELDTVYMPRLRAMMNGIGVGFSRSDLMSRCMFVEHPVVTCLEDGKEQFEPLSTVEARWKILLPEVFGSLLSAIGSGLRIFRAQGGLEGKKAENRFVEYCIIGECISEAMGFPVGLFTQQVKRATEEQKDRALAADDCAELVLSWLNGERGGSQLGGFDDLPNQEKADAYEVSATELYAEIRGIAGKRNYAVYSMKWLNSLKSFATALRKSKKTIEHAGWEAKPFQGGDRKGSWKFTNKNQANHA